MKAYKLFRIRKNGTIGPLFINRKQIVPVNKWIDAEFHPTKGFKQRKGWHCTPKPFAPHLKENLKDGTHRVWFEVEINDYEELMKPESQGGLWYLAQKIKIIKQI
jgi:hypothetical protein